MSSLPPDTEIIELTLQLAELSISVRGPPDQAADFVRRASQLRHSSGYNSAASAASAPRPASASQGSEPPRSTTSSTTRQSLLASFPPCPASWISAATSNLRSGSSQITPAERAQRAWIAGQWAGATIRGEVATPNATPSINLGNRFWVVLRCEYCNTPRIFTSSSAYFQAIQQLEGSDTVSHAFPSETEAKIYVSASGLEIPSSYN